MAKEQQLTTKRPGLATASAVLHFLLGVCILALVIYILLLTRSPKVLREPDAAEAVHGLKLAAAMFAPGIGIYWLAAYGLWTRRRLGWLLGAVADLGLAVVLLWGPVFEHDPVERDLAALIAMFVVPLLLLLLPPVPRFYWVRTTRSPAATVSPEQRADAARQGS